MAIENYYYDKQFRRYIIQFMEIFNGLCTKTGKREDGEIHTLPVPITYASRDRATAAILASHTQNSMIRLPQMSAVMSGISMAPELRKGVGTSRRQSFLPRGGMIPNDVKVVHQLMPIPYEVDMDLSIYTSNLDQQHQILEQILLFFDPTLQIQTSDESFDWTKITSVELKGIRFDESNPMDTDRRIIVSNLSFSMPVYLAAPSNLKKDFVESVYARISTVNDMDEFIQSITSAMDDEYTTIASTDDLTLDQ